MAAAVEVAGMAATDGGWREARAEDRTAALVGNKIKVFWDDANGMWVGCRGVCVGAPERRTKRPDTPVLRRGWRRGR